MKLCAFLTVAAVSACVAGISARASVLLELVPQSTSVIAGDTVSMAAVVSGLGLPPEVGAFDITIGFNPSLLTETFINFGTSLGDPSLLEALTATTTGLGTAEAAEVSLLANAQLDVLQSPSFTLFTVDFIAEANGLATFSYLRGPIDDGNGNLLFGTKIPEPSTIVLLGFVLLCLLTRRYKTEVIRHRWMSLGLCLFSALLWTTSSFGQPCEKEKIEGGGIVCKEGGASCNGGRGICQTIKGVAGDCICAPITPPPCKDPGAIATFLTSPPITTFPATRTFTAVGNVTITDLTPTPVNTPLTGSFDATLSAIPDNQVQVAFSNWNLIVSSFALNMSMTTGPIRSLLRGPENFAIVDQTSGNTMGGLWTTASSPNGNFEPGATFGGVLNFATGEWTISTGNASSCRRCDINADGQVDRNDIALILAARGTAAGLEDPRDVDGDGFITVNDARICTQACKNPRCAP